MADGEINGDLEVTVATVARAQLDEFTGSVVAPGHEEPGAWMPAAMVF